MITLITLAPLRRGFSFARFGSHALVEANVAHFDDREVALSGAVNAHDVDREVKPPSTGFSVTMRHSPRSALINSTREYDMDPFSPTGTTKNGKLAFSFSTS